MAEVAFLVEKPVAEVAFLVEKQTDVASADVAVLAAAGISVDPALEAFLKPIVTQEYVGLDAVEFPELAMEQSFVVQALVACQVI